MLSTSKGLERLMAPDASLFLGENMIMMTHIRRMVIVNRWNMVFNVLTKAIILKRRPVQVITPVNSTHRFVLQAIEKGTLQNLVFDNQAFASHRAMAAVFGTILKLPPLKQAMAGR